MAANEESSNVAKKTGFNLGALDSYMLERIIKKMDPVATVRLNSASRIGNAAATRFGQKKLTSFHMLMAENQWTGKPSELEDIWKKIGEASRFTVEEFEPFSIENRRGPSREDIADLKKKRDAVYELIELSKKWKQLFAK